MTVRCGWRGAEVRGKFRHGDKVKVIPESCQHPEGHLGPHSWQTEDKAWPPRMETK